MRRGVGAGPASTPSAAITVADVGGDRAERVERRRKPLHAGQSVAPERGLETHDAAIGGRTGQRGRRLRSERQVDHAASDGRSRPARGSAGRAREIMGIAGCTWAEEGKFGGDGLADRHRASGFQQRHTCRIGERLVAGIDRRAVAGGCVGGVDDVLDAERQAGEWPRSDPPPHSRALRITGYEGADLPVEAFDRAQCPFYGRLWTAAADLLSTHRLPASCMC